MAELRGVLPAVVMDGALLVVRSDCPTCQLVLPVAEEARRRGAAIDVVHEDDDEGLARSASLAVETVPSLLRFAAGDEAERVVGWHRDRWQTLLRLPGLGAELPQQRPGCGSRTQELAFTRARAAERLQSVRVPVARLEDPWEACFARGWTDGLPVMPPTPERVAAMLEGTVAPPDAVMGAVPPSGVETTVEAVAINAVMAGCLPEYLPVVLAALRAMLSPEFNLHGVVCTTYAVGPVIVVNGPARRTLAMNSGMNVFGQGNRANATIGRAVQLVIRNVGGGHPGALDRATFGNPGKYTCCFAEDEEGSPWEPLSVERGFSPDQSTVTVFAGEAPRASVDEHSRTAASLARSLAWNLETVGHRKKAGWLDAMVVVGPQHGGVLRDSGWNKARLRDELVELLTVDGADLLAGAGGCDQHMTEVEPGIKVRKFDSAQIHLVFAGGRAGPTSAILGGWLRGSMGGSAVVTEPVGS